MAIATTPAPTSDGFSEYTVQKASIWLLAVGCLDNTQYTQVNAMCVHVLGVSVSTYESGDGAERLDEDDTGGGEHTQPDNKQGNG